MVPVHLRNFVKFANFGFTPQVVRSPETSKTTLFQVVPSPPSYPSLFLSHHDFHPSLLNPRCSLSFWERQGIWLIEIDTHLENINF